MLVGIISQTKFYNLPNPPRHSWIMALELSKNWVSSICFPSQIPCSQKCCHYNWVYHKYDGHILCQFCTLVLYKIDSVWCLFMILDWGIHKVTYVVVSKTFHELLHTQVAQVIFAYIRLMREAGPQPWFYTELQVTEQNKFNWKEKVCWLSCPKLVYTKSVNIRLLWNWKCALWFIFGSLSKTCVNM